MAIRRIEPSFRERVWGRTQLEPWFPNQKEETGEVWFEGPELPLLVKFLFTSSKLSVQVHPDDTTARELHDSPGKTEMWHVLAAEPGAKIAAGFREPITTEQLRESAVSGEIEDLLEWHDAAAGDTFFIPAGTVHAIGAGLVLCEIQQASDITYRLYDYGRGRELHLDQGVKVSHRDRCKPHVTPRENSLVSCEHFTVARLGSTQTRFSIDGRVSTGGQVYASPKDDAAMVIVIDGIGEIDGSATRAGEVWMVAAGTVGVEFSGELTVLTATV
jgi:mannose-6-phosphate isomerase